MRPQKPLSWQNQPPQCICSLPSQLSSSYTCSGLQQTEPQEASCRCSELSLPSPTCSVCVSLPPHTEDSAGAPPTLSLLQWEVAPFPRNFMALCSSLMTLVIFIFFCNCIQYIISTGLLNPEGKGCIQYFCVPKAQRRCSRQLFTKQK